VTVDESSAVLLQAWLHFMALMAVRLFAGFRLSGMAAGAVGAKMGFGFEVEEGMLVDLVIMVDSMAMTTE